MVQSEKMMSVGGLAAGMAHEINNPLAGILQNLQVMRNRVTHDTERNVIAATEAGTSLEAIQAYMHDRGLLKMMDSISEAGRRAAKIVDNMLSFSRKDEAHFAPNNLAEILELSIELASNDYNLKKRFDFRHIKVDRDYDDTLDLIPCESSQIQQVILNLLSNSAQVELTAQIHSALKNYHVSGAQHGTSGNSSERLREIASKTTTTKANVATALQMISWGLEVNELLPHLRKAAGAQITKS